MALALEVRGHHLGLDYLGLGTKSMILILFNLLSD